ncbi:MAG TPA: dihydrolipoamide acetyltransferase family protein [Aestuariivirga sp.]|nr:dihydrolipoamide acetyltransferase family protein [Aestuariivirga sp.]
MGRYIFKLPDVGEGVAEAEIVKWHAAVGDEIGEEQPLVDIMTDKATVEIVSPVSGRIVSRNGEEGSKLAVGSEFVVFEIEGGEAAPEPAAPKAETAATISHAATGTALASPAVRERARAMGVDLATVAGTGPGGRVVHGDLDHLLAAGRGRPASSEASLEAGSTRITGLRRLIAERMEVANQIPHFTYVEEVDVTALEVLRAELNSMKGTSARLTVLPFIIRALVKCLGGHPAINAHYDSAQGVVRRFDEVHVGIATQTDRGLFVPVIHNAEGKDIWQLAAEIARLSEAARSGKSLREELSGSTITVTSLGALGGVAATPIINSPEVAIIGVNRVAERPVVQGGAIVIAKMMNLSSSFDHRIVDGYEAAAFIKAVKDCLETPTDLVLAPKRKT